MFGIKHRRLLTDGEHVLNQALGSINTGVGQLADAIVLLDQQIAKNNSNNEFLNRLKTRANALISSLEKYA